MKTKDLYAWINLMPPKPNDLHVIGEVLVGNPGIQAQLNMREPQGINPNILFLDLNLIQQSGMWPEVMTWVPVRYDKVLSPSSIIYTNIEFFHESNVIETIEVDQVE